MFVKLLIHVHMERSLSVEATVHDVAFTAKSSAPLVPPSAAGEHGEQYMAHTIS